MKGGGVMPPDPRTLLNGRTPQLLSVQLKVTLLGVNTVWIYPKGVSHNIIYKPGTDRYA